MRIFRNVFRRKMRAFLTIFGITIGVFALVVMGSMAEKINLLIDGGTRYYSDKVVVTDGSAGTAGFTTTPSASAGSPKSRACPESPARRQHLDDARREGGMSMGVPQGIAGSDLRSEGYESFKLTMKEGRDLTATDRASPSSDATSPKRWTPKWEAP